MKVLITGGAGFIGSHTADRLLKEGYEVRVLDSLQKPIHNAIPDYLDERIEFIAGSATDVRAITEALQGVDYVYHLAAFQDYLPYFSKFVDVNVALSKLATPKSFCVIPVAFALVVAALRASLVCCIPALAFTSASTILSAAIL